MIIPLPLQGDPAPRGLYFVDTLVECSTVLWAVTLAPLLPGSITETLYFDGNKMKVQEVLNHTEKGTFNNLGHTGCHKWSGF